MTILAVPDAATFEAWERTFLGHAAPFEHAGRRWVTVSVSYGALDGYGYSPPDQLEAVEVVPQEIWGRVCFEHGEGPSRPGEPGLVVRIGHASKGEPWVYTGARLRAGTNCGGYTDHCPTPLLEHRSEVAAWAREVLGEKCDVSLDTPAQ